MLDLKELRTSDREGCLPRSSEELGRRCPFLWLFSPLPCSASSVKSSFTFSSANRCDILLDDRIFWLRTRMSTRSSDCEFVAVGNTIETCQQTRESCQMRSRSSGSTLERRKFVSCGSELLSAVHRILWCSCRASWRSSYRDGQKRHPTIKRIFCVFTLMYSWFGCFRPPLGGTLATVPSTIFKRACCTPSPDTSRVIETLEVVLRILSISST